MVYIGTSGWHYKHWLGRFYPDRLPASRMLAFYVQHLDTVELNNSFYRLPSEAAFRDWHNSTPAKFSFCGEGQPLHHPYEKVERP